MPSGRKPLYPRSRRDSLVDRAYDLVSKAVKSGELPPLPSCVCADCGAPAECYDHRDYTRPLAVEPVCKGCNNRRGPGWPFPETSDGTIHKHGVKDSGRKWSGLDCGEGFAPLEAKLAGALTTEDVFEAVKRLEMTNKWNGSVAFMDNRSRVTSTAFSTGKQGGMLNVSGIARAEWFKRKDPWYA